MSSGNWEWESVLVGGNLFHYFKRGNKRLIGVTYRHCVWEAVGSQPFAREVQTVLRVSEKLSPLSTDEAQAIAAATVLTML